MNLLALEQACGFDIPDRIADLVSMIIMLIQYGVPILLIIFGMLDLGKAVIASKEDEIKKGQNMFIKRLIAAVIVFFVVAVVKLVVGLAAEDDDKKNLPTCIDQIVKYHFNK
jgi:D-alanyl-lipoteichoic acid acyltransferase DltB (MBOAT superfamily)